MDNKLETVTLHDVTRWLRSRDPREIVHDVSFGNPEIGKALSENCVVANYAKKYMLFPAAIVGVTWIRQRPCGKKIADIAEDLFHAILKFDEHGKLTAKEALSIIEA